MQGYIQYRKMLRALLLSCLIVSPIILHQAAAYVQFCTEEKPPDWCQRRIPLVYSHVQAKYWDVGLFRYWTLSQIPNFLLAAPSLALLIWAGWTHMKVQGYRQIADIGRAVGLLPRRRIYRKALESSVREESLLTSNKTTPHAIHALVLCFILVFASHTQIVLRLASSLPFTHWASARLWIERPQVAKWWTGWCVLWSMTSLVTWGLFLPPA
jgi:GPI mannosyltransferase 2